VRLVKLALLMRLATAVPAAAQERALPDGAVARVGDELVPKTDVEAEYLFNEPS
jgi:hypothetical protein